MILNALERLYISTPIHRVDQIRNFNFLRKIHQLAPGGDVIEIGCGRGVAMRLIVAAFEPEKAEGLDIDPRMVEVARRRLRDYPEDRVAARMGDAENLPYESASIDAVFDFGVLHHLEHWRAGLAEVARVLKPGGHFYVEEYFPALYANAFFRKLMKHPEEGRFSAEEFSEALAEAWLTLMQGASSSKYRLLGVAVKSVWSSWGT